MCEPGVKGTLYFFEISNASKSVWCKAVKNSVYIFNVMQVWIERDIMKLWVCTRKMSRKASRWTGNRCQWRSHCRNPTLLVKWSSIVYMSRQNVASWMHWCLNIPFTIHRIILDIKLLIKIYEFFVCISYKLCINILSNKSCSMICEIHYFPGRNLCRLSTVNVH